MKGFVEATQCGGLNRPNERAILQLLRASGHSVGPIPSQQHWQLNSKDSEASEWRRQTPAAQPLRSLLLSVVPDGQTATAAAARPAQTQTAPQLQQLLRCRSHGRMKETGTMMALRKVYRLAL